MAACISSSPSQFLLSSDFLQTCREKPTSLSWSSSWPQFNLSINSISSPLNPTFFNRFQRKAKNHNREKQLRGSFRFSLMRNRCTKTSCPQQQIEFIVQAAWTRRSRGEAAKKPNRKSWGQRTDMYMRPFLLNIFFSKRFVHAKVMHRGTSKVISVATTNAKDLRNTLPSLTDDNACRVIGKLIAERSKEADVFAMSYEPQKNERIEGKLGIVIDTIKENGIIFV